MSTINLPAEDIKLIILALKKMKETNSSLSTFAEEAIDKIEKQITTVPSEFITDSFTRTF